MEEIRPRSRRLSRIHQAENDWRADWQIRASFCFWTEEGGSLGGWKKRGLAKTITVQAWWEVKNYPVLINLLIPYYVTSFFPQVKKSFLLFSSFPDFSICKSATGSKSKSLSVWSRRDNNKKKKPRFRSKCNGKTVVRVSRTNDRRELAERQDVSRKGCSEQRPGMRKTGIEKEKKK